MVRGASVFGRARKLHAEQRSSVSEAGAAIRAGGEFYVDDFAYRLVAVEQEEEAAARLIARFAGTNVEVVRGDAAALGYPDATFDTVATCTMLHHVPTRALQDKVLAEAFRVLRAGGTFLGSDSLPSDDLHKFHEGDTYNPVEPAGFLTRLQTVGFATITLHVSYNLVFTARKGEDSP